MSTQEQYPQDAAQADYAQQTYAPQDSAYYEEEAPPPRNSMMPVILSMVAGLVVVGLLGAMMLKPASNPTPPTTTGTGSSTSSTNLSGLQVGPNVGMIAPDFTIDRADEQAKITLSSYRGQKPVWVNIWATWCPPCRGEMPEMEKIWGQYKDQVEILGIDFQESPQQVQEFVKNNGYSWTFALDRDTAVGRAYQATGIPTHAFVDKSGVVRYIIRGGLSRDMMMQGLASVGVK